MEEFELIDRFVRRLPRRGEGVIVGIGDDAAVLRAPRGEVLVATVDAVVEGVHFGRGFTPEDVGWKSLTVNLSDIAAMGARPLWALVALAVPRGADPAALFRVAAGLGSCARRFGVVVVGGNVTAATELSLTVTVLGSARADATLRRAGARLGDEVLVSGTLGDAAVGLEPDAPAALRARQRRPVPRLALGRALASIASAAIDISDGLAQDLGHLCRASRVGARVRLADLPLSAAYRAATRGRPRRFDLALAGGEDYELCVTVPPRRLSAALGAARRAGTRLTAVGTIVEGRRVSFVAPDGRSYRLARAGHDHLAPRAPLS